jgi:quinol monooxygenase YgiN
MQNKDCFGVVAHIKSPPTNVGELRRLMLDLVSLTQHEDGCLSCEIIENENDPGEFTLLERWSNEVTHHVHFTTSSIRDALQALSGLLSKDLGARAHLSRPNTTRYGTNSYLLEVY